MQPKSESQFSAMPFVALHSIFFPTEKLFFCVNRPKCTIKIEKNWFFQPAFKSSLVRRRGKAKLQLHRFSQPEGRKEAGFDTEKVTGSPPFVLLCQETHRKRGGVDSFTSLPLHNSLHSRLFWNQQREAHAKAGKLTIEPTDVFVTLLPI